MSSHHIVREKQEPALLIIDLHNFDEEYLGQLLEWSPSVMVAYPEFDKVASLGIKIDTVICPAEINAIPFQEHIKVVNYQTAILNDALKYLVAEGFPAVNVINYHFEEKEYQHYVDKIDLVIFNSDNKIYPIKSGFTKWKAQNEEIIVLHEKPIPDFATNGLKHLQTNNYQTEKDGFFGFSFSLPFIFIAEKI